MWRVFLQPSQLLVVLLSVFASAYPSASSIANDSDIGYFWQLTDFHVDLNYTERSECEGQFGYPKCDSSPALAWSAIDATKQLISTTGKPDFVIWSGDNGPHRKALTAAELKNGIQSIVEHLLEVFGSTTYVLPVLGNHDVLPSNLLSPEQDNPDRLAWCHELATDKRLWAMWIQQSQQSDIPKDNKSAFSNPPEANFSQGCFFSHLLHPTPNRRLLLVSLNALIWYNGNALSADAGPDPLGQLKWLNESFAWARETQTKVLLASHFPPGASENSPRKFRFLHPDSNRLFVRMLRKNADLLMAGLFAHTHVDSFRVLSSVENEPIASLFTAPSITPLRLSGLGSPNPRIRLYRYHRLTGQLLGYTQLFVNLSQANAKSTIEWQHEYDTQELYKLPNLSASSLTTLLDVFEQDASPDGLWSQYWFHELGGQAHEALCPDVDSAFRCEHLCPMRHVDLDELDECLQRCSAGRLDFTTPRHAIVVPNRAELLPMTTDNATKDVNDAGYWISGGRSSLPVVVGVIIGFLVILVGVVLLVNHEFCRNRSSRYTRRFGNPVSMFGGVLFSSINGAYPSGRGGGGGGGGGIGGGGGRMDLAGSIAGSSTELQLAFHPDHRMEDQNESMSTLHTAAEEEGVGGGLNRSMNSRHRQKPDALHVVTAMNNHQTTDGTTTPTITTHGKQAYGGLIIPMSAFIKQSENSLLDPTHHGTCHTEDYYADDEEFADDEAFADDEGTEPNHAPLLTPAPSPTSSNLSSTHIVLGLDDELHCVPLDHSSSQKPPHEWHSLRHHARGGGGGGGTCQSVDDIGQTLQKTTPLKPVLLLTHSQSVTLNQPVDSLSTKDRMHHVALSTTVSPSPSPNGRATPRDSVHSCLSNGKTPGAHLTQTPWRDPQGYSYVRI